MLKPPHPIARAAYALAIWINPNNHALDGGRASSDMEMEAVRRSRLCSAGRRTWGIWQAAALWQISRRSGWPDSFIPERRLLASAQAHYTHGRISSVLGLPFEELPCDVRGRMDTEALAERLDEGDIGTVVVTLGTTGDGGR